MSSEETGIERLSTNPHVEDLKLFAIAKMGQMVARYQKDLRRFDGEEDRVFLHFEINRSYEVIEKITRITDLESIMTILEEERDRFVLEDSEIMMVAIMLMSAALSN